MTFFAALPGALWRLPILGLFSESLNAWNDFSALLLLWLGSFGRRMGTLSAPVCRGLLFTSRCTSPTPPLRGACWAPKEFFLWVHWSTLIFMSVWLGVWVWEVYESDPWMMCHSCMHSLPNIHSPPWDLACRSPLFFFSLLFLPIFFSTT